MNTLFFRLLDSEDKATTLSEAADAIREGRLRIAVAHVVDPASFRQVPGAPFAYWVSERWRRLFTELLPFEAEGRTAKQGLATADDFRFVRAWWAMPQAMMPERWFPFAKGGMFSPFYADVHLVVNWEWDGAEIKNNLNDRGQVRSNVWMLHDTAVNFFFRTGLIWPRRTNGFSLRVMPAGCIFADKGPSVFVEGDNSQELLALAAITNSSAFGLLVSLQLARTELAQSYEVGLIQKTPIPELSPVDQVTLATLAHRAWSLTRALDTHTENSHAFTLPALLLVDGIILAERAVAWIERVRRVAVKLAAIQAEIDAHCFDLYSIAEADRRAITKGFGTSGDSDEPNAADEDENEDDENATAATVALLTATA